MKVMERYTVIEQEAAVLVGISAVHKNLGLIERPEYALLRQINEYGMVGITELADEFHLEWDTIFDHIQRLLNRQFAVTTP